MILNDAAAVRAFQQLGSVTLGGNLSIAAGPIGRNAEASGAANFKAIAPVFSYSKTKGLFAGVSLEGSVLIERRDANRKFYGAPVTAKQLLTGQYPAPPAADPLYQILNTRAFSGDSAPGDNMYTDIPQYGDNDDEWDDDPQYSNRNRAGSVGRSNAPDRYGGTGGRGHGNNESWRNNFGEENDDLDDYDRQERSYKDSMYAFYLGVFLTLGSLQITLMPQDRTEPAPCPPDTAKSQLVRQLQNRSSQEKTPSAQINTLPNSHSRASKAVISALRKETSSKSQKRAILAMYPSLLRCAHVGLVDWKGW